MLDCRVTCVDLLGELDWIFATCFVAIPSGTLVRDWNHFHHRGNAGSLRTRSARESCFETISIHGHDGLLDRWTNFVQWAYAFSWFENGRLLYDVQ